MFPVFEDQLLQQHMGDSFKKQIKKNEPQGFDRYLSLTEGLKKVKSLKKKNAVHDHRAT
jgi:hypothetical protein